MLYPDACAYAAAIRVLYFAHLRNIIGIPVKLFWAAPAGEDELDRCWPGTDEIDDRPGLYEPDVKRNIDFVEDDNIVAP